MALVTAALAASGAPMPAAIAQSRPAAAQAPAAPGSVPTAVSGTVLQVNSDASPGQLTVQAGTAIYTYQVPAGVSIVRSDSATGAGGPVSLGSISPGDQVLIAADQSGLARSIRATYEQVSGPVAAVTANTIVLQDGNSYRVHPSARVLENGTAAGIGSLRPGDVVTLRLNPQTNEVWGATLRGQASVNRITAVTVAPANRVLTTGDVLTVTATGPAGGIAAFSIAGLRRGLPMIEQVGNPGTYIGTYTVQAGDYAQNAQITVQITTPTGQVVSANAPVAVSINAAAARFGVTAMPR